MKFFIAAAAFLAAVANAAPEADAEAAYYGGYGLRSYGYGYPYAYGAYGRHFYKREADAEPEAYYGNYYGARAYGYGYPAYGYGYPAYGYGHRAYGHGKRSADAEADAQ